MDKKFSARVPAKVNHALLSFIKKESPAKAQRRKGRHKEIIQECVGSTPLLLLLCVFAPLREPVFLLRALSLAADAVKVSGFD